jgi:hypothetical protein
VSTCIGSNDRGIAHEIVPSLHRRAQGSDHLAEPARRIIAILADVAQGVLLGDLLRRRVGDQHGGAHGIGTQPSRDGLQGK